MEEPTYTLPELLRHWQSLSGIKIDENGTIDSPFMHFEAGTPEEQVWSWFEEQHPVFSSDRACVGDFTTDLTTKQVVQVEVVMDPLAVVESMTANGIYAQDLDFDAVQDEMNRQAGYALHEVRIMLEDGFTEGNGQRGVTEKGRVEAHYRFDAGELNDVPADADLDLDGLRGHSGPSL